MPELHFIGKEFVYNHHLTVPYRPLVAHPEKGIGEGSLDDNLIIHGDNLHALKALLPRYAGKVDCIFIDPPYNTGNEGWSYNDNVSSPLIKEWLSGSPINVDDMLRHDKWCCMMWPRLRLLWELLSADGTLWVTLDDNEVHRARGILDEIFGGENFVATVIWHKVFSPKNSAQHFSEDHDYVLCYAKSAIDWRPRLLPRTVEMDERFSNPDNDPRGVWTSGDLTARNYYSKGKYTVRSPGGKEYTSGNRFWRQSLESFRALDADGRVWWGVDGNSMPRMKRFLSDVRDGVVPQTIWHFSDVGHTQDAKKQLLEVMQFADEESVFVTPKPTGLIERVVGISNGSLILDSFSGSGSTAHAIAKMNANDGGNRRFILVECEDYADTLTAERVRRVIKGYPYQGTQKETLYEQKLNLANLKKADQLLQEATNAVTFHEGSYDQVETKVENGVLRVTGIRKVEETAPGLGGTFTYCTLGEPIDLDKILLGEAMPSYENMAAWLVHTAFGTTLPPSADHRSEGIGEWYIGETDAYHVWLIYRPDKSFLQSKESALTLEIAEAFSKAKPGKPSLVFAPSKYVGKKYLDALTPRVEYAPLPFALYRLERG